MSVSNAASASSSSPSTVGSTFTATSSNTLYTASVSLISGAYTITCVSTTTSYVDFYSGSTLLGSAVTSSGTTLFNLASPATKIDFWTNTGSNIVVNIALSGIGFPSSAPSGTVDILTTSGTYNQTGNVYVVAVGGGGGGGNGGSSSNNNVAGSGGGGGGSVSALLTLNTSTTYNIGAAGNGGASGGGQNPGGAGGATTFSNLTANGGGGGPAYPNTGGGGGSGSGGYVVNGNSGGASISAGTPSYLYNFVVGNSGGNYGKGGAGLSNNITGTGNPGGTGAVFVLRGV